jgi:hypothetical protein
VQYLESAWAFASGFDSETARPDASVERVISNVESGSVFDECTRGIGPILSEVPAGQRVTVFECIVRYPTIGSLPGMLTPAESDAFDAYQARFLLPCLAIQGEEVSFTEAGADSGAVGDIGPTVDPYDLLADAGVDTPRIAELSSRCPPVPAWLDIARGQ